MHKDMRRLAIALLDDEHGINEDGYAVLSELLLAEDEENRDIINAVSSVEGRVFLPEDHGFESE